MPKRAREDELPAEPRLSAVAQQRLRKQHQLEEHPPIQESAVKVRKTKLAVQKRHEQPILHANASNGDFAKRRAEIGAKLCEWIQADPIEMLSKKWSPARPSPKSTPSGSREKSPFTKPSPTGTDTLSKSEESALPRIRVEPWDKKWSATNDDEDVEMGNAAGTDGSDAVNSEAESSKLTQVSSFVATDENCGATDSGITFRLQPDETLAILGMYQITVMKGSVSISGAELSPTSPPQTVYAPMTHSLPMIEVPSSKRQNSTGAEVLITSHHSGLLEIGNLCPTFNSIWKGPAKDTATAVLSFTPIFTSATNIPTVSIPTSWKPTLKTLIKRATSVGAPPPTILLTGPKGAGKSTFSRILANMLLTTTDLDVIAYLDVDPGQPEFSPPGTISLSLLRNPVLGPPFTHTSPLMRSHHLGYTSPREDPGFYIHAIIDLLSTHQQSHPSVPLLINTAGWIKGLGLELLQDIIARSEATDVIFFGGGGQAIADIIPPNTSVLHELSSAVASSSSTKFTPADLRILHTMAYFHRLSSGWDFSTPLTGFAPWIIPYTGVARGIDAVHILGETIATDELRTAIEGTIVSIVVVAEHNLPESFTATPSVTTAGEVLPPILEAPLTPEVADCKGLAVVRAIHPANGDIHLVSPVAETEIEQWERQGGRVVLVRGRLELSMWEMLLPGRNSEKEVPWVSTGEGKRTGAVWRVRRNVMRRGQQ